MARLDFNKDGRVDLALINANAPRLQLFRNNTASEGTFAAIRLVGGHRGRSDDVAVGQPWSNRDGVGARVRLRVGSTTFTHHLQAGEGFASQHSATLLIGLGSAQRIDELKVLWPSGRESHFSEIPVKKLLVVDERAGNTGLEIRPYER